jgi:hypothetical protein
MIQTYFAQIKRIIDQYAATSFVLEARLNIDIRPGDQGYLTSTLTFADDSKLHVSEYLDQTGESVDKLMYTYHYQDADNRLIFRYDNARHKPALASVEHKHLPTQIIAASAPTLDEVREISLGKNTKLELTWIGKENRPKLEPRILIEDPERSYHAPHRVSKHDLFDNILIHGDNLLALKALEQEFAGKVKCIYIDPPYNTGSAFEHDDDGIEHSIWLSLMRSRIEILWRLLRNDGALWISIDDREMPYLRILLDEICGRSSFIASNIWQKRYSRENREAIGDVHEYVLLYAKDRDLFNVHGILCLSMRKANEFIRIQTTIRVALGVLYR